MARILVIDDDEMLRHTIGRILRRAGDDVIEAGDGAAGLRLYREQRADLVLTDTFRRRQSIWERRAARLPCILMDERG